MIPKVVFSLCLVLALSACEPPQSPDPARSATPSPTPEPTPELATVSDFAGTWAAVDDTGRLFNLILTKDGRAVSNWPGGRAGAAGERAFWRLGDNEAILFTSGGWSSRIHPYEEGHLLLGYEWGANLAVTPASRSATRKLHGPETEFIGVWRLNEEPENGWLYVSIYSDGTARSSMNPDGTGEWELHENGIRITWADGWTDEIRRGPDGYRKLSWPPEAELTSDPADASPAIKASWAAWTMSP